MHIYLHELKEYNMFLLQPEFKQYLTNAVANVIYSTICMHILQPRALK